MPITIKSSRMQYRKSNGDYVGVDAVSERKTSEFISAIESTGSATQSAIEQTASTARDAIDTKAQQARDSIPSDYTALSDEVSDLKSAFTLVEDETVISRVDASDHTAIATEVLRFWDVIIPENALIESLTLPVGGIGANAYLYIGVWELDESGTTLTKVKTCQADLKANSVITVPIWHQSNRKRYISQIRNNCQIYYLNGQSGHYFWLTSNTSTETSSLVVSSLSKYNNMYLVGDISYKELKERIVTNDDVNTKIVNLPWRHGAMDKNSGEIYASVYPIMTDLYIPTNAVDRFSFAVNSNYNAMICYYDKEDGNMAFKLSEMYYVGYTCTIKKNYGFFVIRLFVDWSTVIDPDEGNNIIHAYKDFAFSDVETYAYDIDPLKYKRDINSSLKKRNLDFISISHQGFSLYEIPNHNLKQGYIDAATRGFDYGETDLRLTSDNVLVCCHDDTFVDATTGETVTIANKTYSELQQHDYYGGKIATFDEIVCTCKMNGLGILIDQITTERLPYAISIITKYGMWNKTKWFVVYYPNNPEGIAEHTEMIFNANRNAALYIVAQNDIDGAIAYAKTIKTPYNEVLIHVPYTQCTVQDLIDLLPSIGDELGFSVYTIDSLKTFKEYMPYVKAIISNQISTTDALLS